MGDDIKRCSNENVRLRKALNDAKLEAECFKN